MAKQTSKKMPVKKADVKTAPVAKCACGADCMCGCHRHGSMHIIKHIIVWAIIFALGMACGKMMDCGHHKKMNRKMMQPVFTNGCLDMASVKCPKLAEEVVVADVNADSCISIEEYKAWKKANRPQMADKPARSRGGMRGARK